MEIAVLFACLVLFLAHWAAPCNAVETDSMRDSGTNPSASSLRRVSAAHTGSSSRRAALVNSAP